MTTEPGPPVYSVFRLGRGKDLEAPRGIKSNGAWRMAMALENCKFNGVVLIGLFCLFFYFFYDLPFGDDRCTRWHFPV